LLSACLFGETLVFSLDDLLSFCDDFCVGFDVEGINCSGEVLELNACGGELDLTLIKVVLEGGDEFFGGLSLLNSDDSAIFDFFLKEGGGFFEIVNQSFIDGSVLSEDLCGISLEFF